MVRRLSLRFKTHMSYDDLEEKLAAHCKKPVEVLFEGMEGEEQPARKVMTLVFETDEDRESFRTALSGRRS